MVLRRVRRESNNADFNMALETQSQFTCTLTLNFLRTACIWICAYPESSCTVNLSRQQLLRIVEFAIDNMHTEL